MKTGNAHFATLFKKYRLRSEIRTLSEFGDLLAEEGYVYESSLFTRWENGERYPKKRETIIAILRIFAKRGGIWLIEDANSLLESVEQRDLNIQEAVALKSLFISEAQQPQQSIPSSFLSSRRNITKLLIGLFILGLICWTGIGLFFVNSNKTISSQRSQKLIVGTDPTLSPMEYLKQGQLVGYDIDLAHVIAKELDAEVVFKTIVFDDLFTALEEKQVDIVISAVSITEERRQKFDFSAPYLNTGQVIITRRNSTAINSTADLQGKKIAVQRGTTNEEEALKYTTPNLVIRFEDFVQATQALMEGTVDAVFTDLPNGIGITSTHPELKIAGEPFTDEYYAILLRKNDPLTNEVNEALNRLASEGILVELKQKWID